MRITIFTSSFLIFPSILAICGCHNASQGKPHELLFQIQPPVESFIDIDQLDGEQEIDGQYFGFDIDEDESDEYFVVICRGTHSALFTIIDSDGTPIKHDEIEGDRLVVLRSKHHGFRDIICSSIDPQAVSERLYCFDGEKYVSESSSIHLISEGVDYVEKQENMALACWYADPFSKCPVWGMNVELSH